MKSLIIFGVVALAALFATFYFMGKGMEDDGDIPFGMAVSKIENGEGLLEVLVTFGMTRAESAKVVGGVQQWDRWVAEHFDLRDANGGKVEFRRSNFGKNITEQQAMTPEFYLQANVKPGAYTLDYIPVLADKTRFRHKFTVPAGGIPFERPSLKLVKK
jgi:hypothetical protein